MADYMLENMMEKAHPPHILVNCGKITDQIARDRVDALIAAGIGRANVQIFAFGMRALVRIPPKKAARIFAQFPEITTPGGYSGATHSWGSA